MCSPPPRELWDAFVFVRDYHPWRGGGNPDFDKATNGRILDLKDGLVPGITAAVQDFLRVLESWELPRPTVLAIVPGHASATSNAGRPLARVVGALVAQTGDAFVDGSDVLIRHTTVAKAATGGERGVVVHENSIDVAQAAFVRGRPVIVLDDVTTTGSSLLAARRLLLRAGAERVGALALGRTV